MENEVNMQSVEKHVLQVMGHKPCLETLKHTQLIKQIGADLKHLKNAYKKALYQKEHTGFENWLLDNFYILENEGKSTQRQLKNMPALPSTQDKCAQLYHVLFALYQTRQILLDTQTMGRIIQAIQQVRAMQTEEFLAIDALLRTALVHLAAYSLKAQNAKEQECMFSFCIENIKKIDALDLDALIDQYSQTERLFLQDPACVYAKQDEKTKSYYRYMLSQIAKKEKTSQLICAQQIVKLAREGNDERTRHIGFWLVKRFESLNNWPKRGRRMLCCQMVLPLALCLTLMLVIRPFLLALLLYFPLYAVLKPLLEKLFLHGLTPRVVPTIQIDAEVPQEGKSLMVISTLVEKPEKTAAFEKKMEDLLYCTPKGVDFMVLCDFKEADQPQEAQDKYMASANLKAICRLNDRYPGRFFMLIRKRTFCPTQEKYSGWERKRGALTQLIRLMNGEEVPVYALEGDKNALRQYRYIIALDSDTRPLMDSTQKLIGAAIHPLNRPVIDMQKNMVTNGYGIIAPRIATSLESARKTWFSRIMAGCGGTSAYDSACGELYQDVFGEGIFAGKGIIDVQAFYKLLDHAFDEGKILSHDILESAFLRCAFLSDCEMDDSFPSNLTAWYKRLHRWMRGDVQNLPFLDATIRLNQTERENPLSFLSRFKLFDNVRRAITPVFAFVCLLTALFTPLATSVWLTSIALLCTMMDSLLCIVHAIFADGLAAFSQKFYSKAVPQTFECLLQGLVATITLPQTAYHCLDAVVRSLYRMKVSRRKLLEWTTAADSERVSGKFWGQAVLYLPQILACLLFLFYPSHRFLKLLGVLYLLGAVFAFLSGRPLKFLHRQLNAAQRENLNRWAALMWRFYEDFCTEQEHFLPPDNMQQAPVYKIAHRTSPTNIGFYLLCCLAARDLHFMDSCALATRIENTLATVEKLPKYHGNLYNWYDTQTLAILQPAFVSCVDSGNFVGLLVALKEGLKEYRKEDARIDGLIKRIETIVSNTDLGLFYNKAKKLFSIGYDVQSDSFSQSYYDFLMSEARLTSYFAVATHQAPKKHWGRLSRTMARQNAYAGAMSWTGTMFEYFMPHILLPVHEGTLLFEALRFCLHCQKQRVKGKGVPWGISESAFYSFDNQLNYQYKAHGVQKLGLKRGLDQELVVSPYSSLLTLPYDFYDSYHNLKQMEHLGLVGEYGFFEACDYTRSRCEGKEGQIVRSFMAHHVGMSLLSIANTLNDFSMHKRFMKDKQMQGARELLEEKIPSQPVIYENVPVKEVCEPHKRVAGQAQEYDVLTPQGMHAHMLQNGVYSSLITDIGIGMARYGGLYLTRYSKDFLKAPYGVYCILNDGQNTFSLTKAPFYDKQPHYTAAFYKDHTEHFVSFGDIQAGMKTCVHHVQPLEMRKIAIKNESAQKKEVQMLLYFEPVISTYNDHAAHPAFSKLFVMSEYDPSSNTLLFYRRTRKSGIEQYMAVGFLEPVDFAFETQKEAVLSRVQGLQGLRQFPSIPFSGKPKVGDCVCAIRVKASIQGKGQQNFTFVTAVGASREEAISLLVSQRKYKGLPPQKCACSVLLGEKPEERIAHSLLPKLYFPLRDALGEARNAQKNTLGQSGLWQCGISGDYPIVLVEIDTQADIEQAQLYMQVLKLLRYNASMLDLVVLYSEESCPNMGKQLLEYADKLEMTSCLGQNGGVFLLESSHVMEPILTLLRASAVHIAPKSIERIQPPPFAYAPVHVQNVAPKECALPPNADCVSGGFFWENRFYITQSPALPWCNVLANPSFGTLLSDKALGFTWSTNARENKITPWYNDIAADNTGERILLQVNGAYYDIINGSLCSFSPNDALYEGTAGVIQTKCKVSISAKGNAKYYDITLYNQSEEEVDVQMAYYIEPVLGVNRDTAQYIKATRGENYVCMQNPYNTAVPSALCMMSSLPIYHFTADRAAFFSGRWDEDILPPRHDPCGALIIRKRLPGHRKEKIRFILASAFDEQSALQMAQKAKPGVRRTPNRIWVHTPDETLNHLVNHWLPNQIYASRIAGRTGFYQCGGAYGFRDQLQDVCAYMLLDPKTARQHIVRACAVQFEEGDVLHWWHRLPKQGGGLKGVRTRYSDDALWLAFAVCEYVEKTGDMRLLDVPVAYLTADALAPHEHDRYFSPHTTHYKEPVYNHCVRCIQKTMRFGEHGLCLMGTGDWNDGFNLVGEAGRGESVWLTQFLALVLERFAPICQAKGEHARAEEYRRTAACLKQAIEDTSWDGNWYLRAFYDDGAPLGSHRDAECSIDSLSQSFAVLCGQTDKERQKCALEHAFDALVDSENRIIKLFTPAFDESTRSPGYVKAYPKGVRENGGQYTHAAVWFAIAMLRFGNVEQGFFLLDLLNPAKRCIHPKGQKRYGLEPYYLAADIYTNPTVYGHGGWSLYTGAAGWYYKAVVEELLGIRLKGDSVEFAPRLPGTWDGFEAKLHINGCDLQVTVKRGRCSQTTVNGQRVDSVKLENGEKTVVVQTKYDEKEMF